MAESNALIVEYLQPSHRTIQKQFYKLVGDETSVLSYQQRWAKATIHRSKKISAEWSAIYFQATPEHAKGTDGYRWDQGYDKATLLGIQFDTEKALQVIRLSGPLMTNPDMDGDIKAAAVKEKLALDPSKPLMQQLGAMALLVEELDGEWELVVPHHCFLDASALILSETVVDVLKRPKWMS